MSQKWVWFAFTGAENDFAPPFSLSAFFSFVLNPLDWINQRRIEGLQQKSIVQGRKMEFETISLRAFTLTQGPLFRFPNIACTNKNCQATRNSISEYEIEFTLTILNEQDTERFQVSHREFCTY